MADLFDDTPAFARGTRFCWTESCRHLERTGFRLVAALQSGPLTVPELSSLLDLAPSTVRDTMTDARRAGYTITHRGSYVVLLVGPGEQRYCPRCGAKMRHNNTDPACATCMPLLAPRRDPLP